MKIKAALLSVITILTTLMPLRAVELSFSYKVGEVLYVETVAKHSAHVNGRYSGTSTIKEVTYLKVVSIKKGRAKITGTTYVMEERGYFDKAYYQVKDSRSFTFYKDLRGNTSGLEQVEGLHSFPLFPSKQLKVGESWEDTSFYNISLFNREIMAEKMETRVAYRYLGSEQYEDKEIALISANSVVAREKNAALLKRAKLFKIAGFNNFLIKFDLTNRRLFSIEEVYDYFYVLHDYTVVESSGTGFTTYETPPPVEQEALETLKKESDIKVEKREDHSLSITMEGVKFAPDSAILTDREKQRLDRLALSLRRYREHQIMIVGHTASVGSPEAEMSLSQERARAVLEYLIKKHNFNPALLSFSGKGGTEPIASNAIPEGRARNRRVEIVIMPIK